MKKTCYLLIFLLSFSVLSAQEKLSKEEKTRREKNIQAGNPFARFGYKAKVATLSKGKYLEFLDLDSIVTIGTVRWHVDKNKIVGRIVRDTLNSDAQPIGDKPGRWMSPDPLSEEFPSWSPYNYGLNNPIVNIDPDGREADDWRNKDNKQIYDPSANGGKGAYTEYATKNDIRLGNSLQSTATGKEQFSKLVNSEQKITIEVNMSSIPVIDKDGATQFGKTDTNYQEAKNLDGKIEQVKVTDASIVINVASIEKGVKDFASPTSNTAYDGLNFEQLLGVTVGHEIEHTTETNILFSAQGGNKETKPTAVGAQIATEMKQIKK
jgi:hypothetical protein